MTTCVVTLLLAALTFGATSRASSSGATQGVTKDEIKVGIPLIDFSAIKDFVDYKFGDTKKIAQVFVDDINKNGGINGRKLVPVYKKYPPIPGGKPDPLSLCTAWTEDDKVFAVLGVFIDFTGQGQKCLTTEHNVIHIGHELDQPWIDEAPGGLLLTPDATKEGVSTALVNLLADTGRLKGKTVAVVGDKNNESRVNDVIVPALKKAKAKTGSTAILNITGTDTTAAQAQVDSFIEKWKTEDVNTVFLAGNLVSAKQFAESIKAGLPKAQLITDTDTTLGAGAGRAECGQEPEPVRGDARAAPGSRRASGGRTRARCSSSASTSTRRPPAPPCPVPTTGWSTATARRSRPIRPSPTSAASCSCSATSPRRSDPSLTTEELAEDGRQARDDRPACPTSSRRSARASTPPRTASGSCAYDSTIGDSGDWKTLTPIKDASGGKCAKAAG